MKILYVGHFGRCTGYARAMHDYCAALARRDDVELTIAPNPQFEGLEERYEHLREFCREPGKHEQFEIALYHGAPSHLGELSDRLSIDFDRHNVRAWKHVAITTWEVDPFPDKYVGVTGRFGHIIVPSQFCADLFSDQGIETTVIPHCYDPDFWCPGSPTDGPYAFYSIGKWGARKNMGAIIKAYLHAFSSDDHVVLVLLISNAGDALQDIHALRAASMRPLETLPKMIILGDRLDEKQLLQLHRDAHCYVSASRGEGFGLGLFEACVMNKAIVSPFDTGESEFLTSPFAEVSTTLEPAFVDVKPAPVPLGSPEGAVAFKTTAAAGIDCRSFWYGSSVTSIANGMRYHRGRGNSAQNERDMKRFTYEAVGEQLVNALRKL